MTFLDSIPFDGLLWLVPIFLTIHNMEEAPFMESWYKRLPMKMPLAITRRQFVIMLPFSFYLFRRAFEEDIVTWLQFWLMLGISPVAVVILAFLSLQLGKVFDKKTV